jgi:hypothetical protein
MRDGLPDPPHTVGGCPDWEDNGDGEDCRTLTVNAGRG